MKLLPYAQVFNMDVDSSAYHKAMETLQKSSRARVSNCDYCSNDHEHVECPSLSDALRVAGSIGNASPHPQYLLQKRERLQVALHQANFELVYHYQARERAIASLRRWDSAYRVGKLRVHLFLASLLTFYCSRSQGRS